MNFVFDSFLIVVGLFINKYREISKIGMWCYDFMVNDSFISFIKKLNSKNYVKTNNIYRERSDLGESIDDFFFALSSKYIHKIKIIM